MTLNQIAMVTIPVTDQDKARDFYVTGVDDPDGNNWLITSGAGR